jgi:transposase
MSKLTEADIVEMRRLYGNKKMSLREIAQLFHVHHSTVAEVINHCNPTKSTAPFNPTLSGSTPRLLWSRSRPGLRR